MGIYVTNMTMPKNCAVCALERDIFGRAVCFANENGRAIYENDLPTVDAEERRPTWCPLIFIPKKEND